VQPLGGDLFIQGRVLKDGDSLWEANHRTFGDDSKTLIKEEANMQKPGGNCRNERSGRTK